MTDAWLGRLACGDHSLDALGGAYTNWRALYRETRRLGLKDGELQAAVPAPLYVTIEVWSRGTIAVAYASVLIAAGHYDDALGVLTGADLTADDQAALWRQFLTACLYRQTQRWPDLIAATDVCPPATATYVPNQVLAATQTLAPWLWPLWASSSRVGSDRAVTVPPNAYIAADLQLTKGWCLRDLDELIAADDAFRSAAIEGQITRRPAMLSISPASASSPPTLTPIATRTDKWDPAHRNQPRRPRGCRAGHRTRRRPYFALRGRSTAWLIGLARRQRTNRGVAHRNSGRAARR